jgi:hypothetical protein
MTGIQARINELCNAVLACDATKEQTRAWARDLKSRAGGEKSPEEQFSDIFNAFRSNHSKAQ